MASCRSPTASAAAAAAPPQIRRAFKTLRTAAHPDKGGDADAFHRLVTAYNVLSDPDKVRQPTATLILAWRDSPMHAVGLISCCLSVLHVARPL
jgi:hypothetical protein